MIAIASDHGGYHLKERVKEYLNDISIPYQDFGTDSIESCDYPIFGEAEAQAVASSQCEKGIVICTTGVGISIAANKVKGIRCALCGDLLTAELTRRHNDANMLALGAAIIGEGLAVRIVDTFLHSVFEGTDRHTRRVAMIGALEQKR
ncbi:MAG: ribose 5-phosphate isomerase B [Lachnospiraceae bacterium]|nr:ribose 5-phosphate isomerase B [Lachnospiraceae bacterium]